MTDIKRRSFIKGTLLAGAGAVIAPQFLNAGSLKNEEVIKAHQAKSASGKKVIVAGAGITGLCCAYELMQAGHDVTVLEADGRYGGHVFTGRDGLSDGLYADYGADHITKPGYEKFFEYVNEFKLTALPYPHAEGSDAAPNRNGLRMIGGKFYTDDEMKAPSVLAKLGFNEHEIKFLTENQFYALSSFYLKKYSGKFTDPYQPFGVGYDDLDKIPVSDLYKKEGASVAALAYLGGQRTSALYHLWRAYVMESRNIPLSEGDTYHLKGGNEQLPVAFAKRLGKRVKLNHRITAINHSAANVTVKYKPYGKAEQIMSADFLVNCITLPIFKTIPLSPPLSPEKQYVVNRTTYSSHPFYVFEASSRFWLDDGFKSINMEFEHPFISSIWEETNEVGSNRVILKAYGPGGITPQQVLDAFRQVYPGKHDTIEQVLTKDWTRDPFAPACEMEPFPIGQMHRFWPQIMKPEGRIYFAGTYADNLSRGMESCIRSAQRVANEIDRV